MVNQLLQALWLLQCTREEWNEQSAAAGKKITELTKDELLDVLYYTTKACASAVTGLPPSFTREEAALLEKNLAKSMKHSEGQDAKTTTN